MTITPEFLKTLIADELKHVGDTRVQDHVRGLLVEPEVVLRDWDYGPPGQKFPCWTVLKHAPSGTGIAYSEFGFGPRCPWGLVSLAPAGSMGMGMDSGWFTKFMDAYFDSHAPADINIWRVFRVDPNGVRTAITAEQSWDTAWAEIFRLREEHPGVRFDFDHSPA